MREGSRDTPYGLRATHRSGHPRVKRWCSPASVCRAHLMFVIAPNSVGTRDALRSARPPSLLARDRFGLGGVVVGTVARRDWVLDSAGHASNGTNSRRMHPMEPEDDAVASSIPRCGDGSTPETPSAASRQRPRPTRPPAPGSERRRSPHAQLLVVAAGGSASGQRILNEFVEDRQVGLGSRQTSSSLFSQVRGPFGSSSVIPQVSVLVD